MIYINKITKILIFCFILNINIKSFNDNLIVHKNNLFDHENIIFNQTKLNNNLTIENINKTIDNYNKKIVNENNNKDKKILKDVLFINGCNNDKLPHPYRYRVLHQMEQLDSGFLESDVCFYLNLAPIIIRNYRVIIFYRCPWTNEVGQAIEFAKILNKVVLFDIDDLVFDKKYTDTIPYIQTLSEKSKKAYDDGIERIGKTLKLCNGAITTTRALARELKHYIPNVFINHNVASEEMWKLSQKALTEKNKIKKDNNIIIGYFSGSITHNPDFKLIKYPLLKILREFKNVQILIVGILSTPKFLSEFSSRIIIKPFIDWKQLPKIISNIDINISPIENSIFNEAKSENKWVEASLVKIPTVASNFGEFKNVIEHEKTGFLCSNNREWYNSLKTLINDGQLRERIGENAYNICKKKYNSIYTGIKLSNYINKISSKHIGFFLPNLNISGGIYVILKHACFLKDEGWDVELIFNKIKINIFEFENHKFNTISLEDVILSTQFDVIVATLFSTLYNTLNYYKTKKHLYLVQNYETDFYQYGHYSRSIAQKTYSSSFGVEYITISKWCEKWLKKKYKKNSKYAPNGIDFYNYTSYKRNLNKEKIRILIEGDSSSYYKNVDESFKIVEMLDKNKFEIWYLSYRGKPKEWYRVDNFLYQIPFDQVKNIYYQCDILLKSSWLESFSYPPLEMIATGGFCIVVPNGGNKEYLENYKNCIFYEQGNIKNAISSINRLISDEKLQEELYLNGLITAKNRDWNNFKKQIIDLYDIN